MKFLAMSCRKTRGALESYTCGELEGNQAREVAEHLSVCDACHAEHEALFAVRCALSDYPRVVVSPNFDRIVMSRLEDELLSREVGAENLLTQLAAVLHPSRKVRAVSLGFGVVACAVAFYLWLLPTFDKTTPLHTSNDPAYSATLRGRHDDGLTKRLPPELREPSTTMNKDGNSSIAPSQSSGDSAPQP